MDDFLPSLISRASRNIVISLWHHADTLGRAEVDKENVVIETIRNLSIPPSSKQHILLLVRPVRAMINDYMLNNCDFVSDKEDLYDVLAWTAMGLIDVKATADNILNSGRLEPIDAFKFACINCSTSHIYRLWPLVQSEFGVSQEKPGEYQEKLVVRASGSHPTVQLWVFSLIKGYELSHEFVEGPLLQKAFARAFIEGTVSALDYFHKHTHCYKDLDGFIEASHLVSPRDNKNQLAILFFLLSQMDSVSKKRFLRLNSKNILVLFMEYPLREFFLQILDKLVLQYNKDSFQDCLRYMIEKMYHYKNEASLYKSLFTKLWENSPGTWRAEWLRKTIDNNLSVLFHPISIDDALDLVCAGTCDYQRLHRTLMYDNEALLSVVSEKNAHTAFKTVLKSFLLHDASAVQRFEVDYAEYTEKYMLYNLPMLYTRFPM